VAAALEGIRVVDLTVWFQGPVAAQHLADSAPRSSSRTPAGRRPGPRRAQHQACRSRLEPVLPGDQPQQEEPGLDLKKPAGRDIMYRLVEKSDVFCPTWASSCSRAGTSVEKLSRINPRLVYATNTGYGRFGQVNKPSFDMTVQALTGLMARLGEPDQPPSISAWGPATRTAACCRRSHRARTAPPQPHRQGQMLDASLYGAQLLLTAPTLQPYLATGDMHYANQQSRTTAPNPLWNVYRAKDKWVFLCVPNTDENWARLASTLDDADLVGDARFAASNCACERERLVARSTSSSKRQRARSGWRGGSRSDSPRAR